MSKGGHEREYGRGYVIVPLGSDFLSDFRDVTDHVKEVSGLRVTRHKPHISLMSLGRVPAYKVRELEDAVRGCARNFRNTELIVGGLSAVRPSLCLDVQQQSVARRMNRDLQRVLVGVVRSPRTDYLAHVSVADVVGGASLNSYRDKVSPIFDGLVSRVGVSEVDIVLKYPTEGLQQRIIRIPLT